MFHVNCPLSPTIHRENGVSSKISRVNGNSERGLFVYENQNHNFYKDASLLKQKAWVSPVLLPNCGTSIFFTKLWFKRGFPSMHLKPLEHSHGRLSLSIAQRDPRQQHRKKSSWRSCMFLVIFGAIQLTFSTCEPQILTQKKRTPCGRLFLPC